MISKYITEQKRYTQEDLCSLFGMKQEALVPLIRKLRELGILQVTNKKNTQSDYSELEEGDIVIADIQPGDNKYHYVFTFVGIIDIFGIIIKCYPKYLVNESNPVDKLKQVLKVIEKYNSKYQIIHMFNETNDSRMFNLLAVYLFLIFDYYDNGTYNSSEDIVESNGSGEILWDKTINETFSMISGGRPYYIDLQTKKRINNDYDFFKRLHECILTKASNELQQADLLELFEINEVDLSDEILDDFGDKDYILYRIEKELNIQFNTRKQRILKAIYTYINQSGSLSDVDCISLFGTNSFNLVWEDVCKSIFGNQLDMPLSMLALPKPLNEKYNRDSKLIEIIEKPKWTATGLCSKETLKPDLITISGSDFLIIDAKYYCATLEKGAVPSGQPGIESITKQYLYQLAYKDFINDHGFSSVRNCFVMPTEESLVQLKGEAVLGMLSDLGLQSIMVRFIPAELAFDYYLSGKPIDLQLLNI